MKKNISLILFCLIALNGWAQIDITKLACALGKDYKDPIAWEAIAMLKAYKWSGYVKSEFVVKTVTNRDEFIEFISKCSTSGSSLSCNMPEQKIRIELRGGFVREITFPVNAETVLPDFIKVDRSYKTTLKLYPHYSRFVKKDCNIKKGEHCDLGRIEENVPVPFYAFYETLDKNDVLLSSITLAQPDKPYTACVSPVLENEPVVCFLGKNINDNQTQKLLEKYGIYIEKKFDSKKDEYKTVISNTSKNIALAETAGIITKMTVYDLNLLPAEVRKLATKKGLSEKAELPTNESNHTIYSASVADCPVQFELFNGYYSSHSLDKKRTTENTPAESVFAVSFPETGSKHSVPDNWEEFLNKMKKGKCVYGDCINGESRYQAADGNTIIANFINGLPVGDGLLYTDERNFQFRKWNENGKLTPKGETIGKSKFCVEGDCINGSGTFIDGYKVYKGNFKEGKYHGQFVILTLANSSEEHGNFENGKRHGWFTDYDSNGKQIGRREYINGAWQKTPEELLAEENKKLAQQEKENKQSEKQTSNATAGSATDWKCVSGNCVNGYGKKLETKNKVTYEGNFSDGYFQGLGMLTFPDGTTYYGEFVKDNINGHGRAEYSNGNSYVGYWKNWVFHGEGTYFVDGKWNYKGNFTNGEPTCNTCYNVEVPIPVDNGGTPLYTNRNQWLLESISRQQTERDNQNKYQDSESWFEQYQKRNY